MTGWLRAAEARIGRRTAWVALGAVALGAIAFVTGLFGGDSLRTFGALIASWLFFAGAAAGALAFCAFFRIVDARWARPLAALGGQQAAFTPVVLGVLVVIVAGAGLAPWLHPTARDAFWLGLPRFAVRQLVLNLALFGFAWLQLRARPGRAEELPTRTAALVYCLGFSVVLSIWAFDFVVGADPSLGGSTLIGPYLFVSAFVSGTGVVTLLGLRRGDLGEAERGDVGALVLALGIFWAYLFWSQYLLTWYGNLPDELGFALRRGANGWGVVVLAVVGLVFVAPFVTLLSARCRRSGRVLGGLLVLQLLGLWLNCHLLVVPSLSAVGTPPLQLRDVLIALGMLGAFVLNSGAGSPRSLLTKEEQPCSASHDPLVGVPLGGPLA